MAWTAPRTWVAAEIVTASIGNTHWRDNQLMLSDAWASYTPALTNWTLGNGTLVGRAMIVGKWVRFSIELTLGSTSTTVGTLLVSLPATARLAVTGIAHAHLFDTSAPARRNWTAVTSAAATGVNVADATNTAVNATTPWTWATGDTIFINGEYEVV